MDLSVLDLSIQELQKHKSIWITLPLEEKIHLLLLTRRRLGSLAQAWVDASLRAKQIDPGSSIESEEWIIGPWATAAALNGYIDTLKALSAGRPLKPRKVHTRFNGQVSAQVFPFNIFDFIMLNGTTAEVWMQPGVTEADLEKHMAAIYRQPPAEGQVALVLGAGNVAAIPPRDLLYRLFAAGQVVIMKMNPVNDYLGAILEDVFSPFIQAGFLRFAYGDAEVGEYLVNHAGVDVIHMTGSAATFEAILYGVGEAGAERKRRNQPIMKKPFTGELGSVSPVIILPGKWSRADIRFQAEHVVTLKLQNTGFNCAAAQVLVLSKEWDQRDEFIRAVRKVIQEMPERVLYYPGAAAQQKKVLVHHPEAESYGNAPFQTLVTGLDPLAENEYCFRNEIFGPIFVETSLPGKDAAEFLSSAVKFCNEKLAGDLGATIIAHPQTLRQLGNKFEEELTRLHYGSIGVNIWNAAAFLLVQCTWGGFPGNTFQDLRSGIGVVGNSLMFEMPERTVARGSFHPFPRTWLQGNPAFLPKPPWFLTNKTSHLTAKKVAYITIDPKFRHLPAIILSALLG
jgi:aldehyde dehydrogenase (NAD(P)+)